MLARMPGLDVDPVSAEVIRGAMETVAYEMATHVSLTATTPILNQSNERNAIILDGRGGGTGAAPLIFRNNISVPTIPALARARRHLDQIGRGDVTLIVTGGLRAPSDFVKALALGADGVAMGTRFAATHESSLHDDAKRAITRKDETETIYTNNFDGM